MLGDLFFVLNFCWQDVFQCYPRIFCRIREFMVVKYMSRVQWLLDKCFKKVMQSIIILIM